MPRIMILCPTLNWAVFTGLTTEMIKLDAMLETMTLTVRCPACDSDHKWKREDAWVDEISRDQLSTADSYTPKIWRKPR
jgi:hypothetical protein